VQTSEHYNKIVMGGKEDEIVKLLEKKETDLKKQNTTGQYITFNALVSSKWMQITDNTIAKWIKDKTAAAMKAGSKEEKDEILKGLVKDLGKETDPKYCLSTTYFVDDVFLKNADGKIILNSSLGYDESIGEDTHLKDILK